MYQSNNDKVDRRIKGMGWGEGKKLKKNTDEVVCLFNVTTCRMQLSASLYTSHVNICTELSATSADHCLPGEDLLRRLHIALFFFIQLLTYPLDEWNPCRRYLLCLLNANVKLWNTDSNIKTCQIHRAGGLLMENLLWRGYLKNGIVRQW